MFGIGYSCNCNDQTTCNHVASTAVAQRSEPDPAQEFADLEVEPFIEFWECVEETPYLPPQLEIRAVPCRGPHRPREDVRPASGGRACWIETGFERRRGT